MKAFLILFFSVFCTPQVFGAASPILSCADSFNSIKIDSSSITIARDGITYSFLAIESFFGLIIKPVNPNTGVADMSWAVRIFGVMAIDDINTAVGITLDTNGGTVHRKLSCELIGQ